MGNIASSSGTIRVHTAKPTYQAGEEVSGDVFVYIQSAVQSDGVFLQFKGVERCCYVAQDTRRTTDASGETTSENIDRQYRDEHVFLEVKIPLMGVPQGKLQPGQYQIPFRFILPVGISGSFAETGGSGSQTYECSIAYEFNTYVSIPGLLAFDIKHTQPLVVCSAPSSVPKLPKPQSIEKNQRVMLCCCIPRGKVWLRASIGRDAFCVNEEALVLVEGRNSSDPITSLELQLMKNLQLGRRGAYGAFDGWSTVASSSYPGVAKRQEFVGEFGRRSMSVKLANPDSSPIPPTTTGTVVQCKYFLVVVAHFRYNPSIEVRDEWLEENSLSLSITQALVRVPIELDTRLPAAPSEWSALPAEVLQQQQAGSWNPVMFDAVVATPSAPPMP